MISQAHRCLWESLVVHFSPGILAFTLETQKLTIIEYITIFELEISIQGVFAFTFIKLSLLKISPTTFVLNHHRHFRSNASGYAPPELRTESTVQVYSKGGLAYPVYIYMYINLIFPYIFCSYLQHINITIVLKKISIAYLTMNHPARPTMGKHDLQISSSEIFRSVRTSGLTLGLSEIPFSIFTMVQNPYLKNT